jgi:hypothetical protein
MMPTDGLWYSKNGSGSGPGGQPAASWQLAVGFGLPLWPLALAFGKGLWPLAFGLALPHLALGTTGVLYLSCILATPADVCCLLFVGSWQLLGARLLAASCQLQLQHPPFSGSCQLSVTVTSLSVVRFGL